MHHGESPIMGHRLLCHDHHPTIDSLSLNVKADLVCHDHQCPTIVCNRCKGIVALGMRPLCLPPPAHSRHDRNYHLDNTRCSHNRRTQRKPLPCILENKTRTRKHKAEEDKPLAALAARRQQLLKGQVPAEVQDSRA